MKRTRIRPISRKRQQRDRPYAEARKAVYARAGGLCEAPVHDVHCTGRCEAVHHLAGRQGSDPHRLGNLAGLSRACHEYVHAHPEWAYEVGLMVRRTRREVGQEC